MARTIDEGVDEAVEVLDRLAEVGIDLDDVGLLVESSSVAAFERSIEDVVEVIGARTRRSPVPALQT